MAKRKRYTDEFKREAVGLTRQPGSSVSQVAKAGAPPARRVIIKAEVE
jgi:transposase-like protein